MENSTKIANIDYHWHAICENVGKIITGHSVPIPRHSQTRAKNVGLVTLETQMNSPSKYYHTHKHINK